MTKFIDALEIQVDPIRQQRAVPPKLLLHPITLINEPYLLHTESRYFIKLNWNISVWLQDPVSSDAIESSRNDALLRLRDLVYGEIYSDLADLQFLVKYKGKEEA